MPTTSALRAAAAATTATLALTLAPTSTAAAPREVSSVSAAPSSQVSTSQGSTSQGSTSRGANDQVWGRKSNGKKKRTHRPRSWSRLTTYRRAVLEGCRPPKSHGFRRIVLRLRNAHDKRLRRAEVSFKDRAYSLPWNGGARSPWVRPGRATPLARVSTTGRLVTQRVRVRLRTPHDASPVRSLRWTQIPPCERSRRR
ncbi:hypothetical protein I601_2938 [Nocardioides dokdonensis FR1436]|uniref:Secreted protein n=1 Tax=Nocardioides dokdonensis FR1436 TaxID=1300347 RepID=A0A1A9GP23_9ACTN|nr:hypothetical protein [Nocardioides dokdonensis]ANH39353.1 hypothetical protein I601_2938 [Nocardioides dokdonensis FR1436]